MSVIAALPVDEGRRGTYDSRLERNEADVFHIRACDIHPEEGHERCRVQCGRVDDRLEDAPVRVRGDA